MRTAGWILAVAAILTGLGIYLGTASINRDGTNCGSGFSGVSADAGRDDLERALLADQAGQRLDPGSLSRAEDACAGAVSDRKTVALPLTVVGGVGLLVGLFVFVRAKAVAGGVRG